jgi:SAM-dependent methyltransferase
MRARHEPSNKHWDEVAEQAFQSMPLQAWRAYMRRVYLRLAKQWFSHDSCDYGLKTDLFEEAISPHHLLPDLGPRTIGIDTSAVVVRAARQRLLKRGFESLLMIADVRYLPFRPGSLQQVLSGSSLDHFRCKADIAQSLEQLAQAMTNGGILVITLDNPHNPAIWVRNRLPFSWLNRLGLVPYYVGATYRREEARQQLEAAGLTVTNTTAVGHSPRALAIGLIALAERFGWKWLEAFVAGCLDRCEALELWPTRYITGYYLAFRAEKRVDAMKASSRALFF